MILWCAEKATWMAGEGIQVFGGNGYINEYPLGRLWRDAKLYEIGAGTSRDPPHADRARAVCGDDVMPLLQAVRHAGPRPYTGRSAPMSIDLQELFDNNRRWAEATEEREPGFFTRLLAQQAPQYLWIGCADSRVPANELARPAAGRAVRAPQRRQRGRALRPERAVRDAVRGRRAEGPAHHRRRPLRLRRRARRAAGPARRPGRQLAAPRAGRAQQHRAWLDDLARGPASGRPVRAQRDRAGGNVCQTTVVQDAWARGQRWSCTAGSTACTTGCWKTCRSPPAGRKTARPTSSPWPP